MKHHLISMSCSLRSAQVFLCVLSALLLPSSLYAREGERSRPNIVFILADDLGWADLGCYGNRFNETPRIDKLASQGMKFTDFYAACPVCSPTRASILSGQYQARFGLTTFIPGHWKPFARLAEPPNALQMPLEIVTLAESLKKAGYATGHFGKWHLGGAGFLPPHQGFDDWVVTGGGHGGTRRLRTTPRRKLPVGKRLAEFLADECIAFMLKNKDKPFFVHLSHFAVHIPLDARAKLRKKYEAKKKVAGYPCNPAYAALLEELDTSVGRVIDALDRTGLAQNTLLVFTSDNGGLRTRYTGGEVTTSNAPLRDEKGSLYEGGVRVPLIVRWPGVTGKATVCREPTISIDFYPTFLDAARSKKPTDHILDGVSLGSLLRDPSATIKRQALYWHYPHYHHSRPACSIRAGEWKAIEFFDTGKVELYNLKSDLSESKNLAGKMPAKVKELRSMLRTWRDEVNAQMPQDNPAYHPKRAHEWWSRRRVEPITPRK